MSLTVKLNSHVSSSYGIPRRTWGSNPNKARKNVSSGDPVYSDTFGLVVHRACSKPILSRLTRMYPNVARPEGIRWYRYRESLGLIKSFEPQQEHGEHSLFYAKTGSLVQCERL